MKRLRDEVARFQMILRELHDILEDDDTGLASKLSTLKLLTEPPKDGEESLLAKCHMSLEKLATNLETDTTEEQAKANVMWPFKQQKTHQIIEYQQNAQHTSNRTLHGPYSPAARHASKHHT